MYGAYTAYCMAGSPSEFEDEHGTYPAIYASEVHDTSRNGVESTSRHSRWVRVDPRTVGQSTGLIDKNDKLIFEGDILDATWNTPNDPMRFVVCWMNTKFAGFNLLGINNLAFEIIGNVHDSPELLGVKTP